MKLHELKSIKKRVQRIGRGGKRGSYSGRGVKGQRSRAGHRIRPAERDLIMRIPKLRGFRNKPKTDTTTVFNLEDLSLKLKALYDGKTPVELTKDFLKVTRLLGKNFRGRVKILGDGEITVPVTVKGLMVSKSAKIKIEKVGGTISSQ